MSALPGRADPPLLLQNIQAQPAALAAVLARQLGPGLADLQAAAGELRRARRIVFTAIGSPYFACLPLVRHLKRAGLPADLLLASDLLHDFDAFPEAGDLVVLHSRSGESVEILRLLPLLRRRGARLLAVTNLPESTLAAQADLALVMGCPPDEMVAVQTYTAALLVNALLGQAACEPASLDPGAQTLAAIQALPSLVEVAIRQFAAASQSWGAALRQARAIYLLARRSAFASAQEGALLFHEVAKTPAIAMDAGAFRHGPAEVLDERFYAIVIAPVGPAFDLNAALAQDIAHLGGHASLLSSLPPVNGGHSPFTGGRAPELSGATSPPAVSPPAAAPQPDWWQIPALPELLSPLLEIIPLQFAAYRLAEAQGLHPGQFRICTQVTADESGFIGK
jgi:glucosamine--fructose-6-phosphate aminotransferase (isomerizing)